MADGNSIINLGDLAKPAPVLIEKVSNAAIKTHIVYLNLGVSPKKSGMKSHRKFGDMVPKRA